MKIDQTEDTPRSGLLLWILIALAVVFFIWWLMNRLSLRNQPPRTQSSAEMVMPKGIVFHHSDTPTRLHGKSVDASRIDEMHALKGFSTLYGGRVYHIGYHYVILPNGVVQAGRPELCPGCHTRGYNDHYLGICLIGDFCRGNVPTKRQVESATRLSQALIDKYHIPLSNVICHRDVNQTLCPGPNFPYRHILARLNPTPTSRQRLAKVPGP